MKRIVLLCTVLAFAVTLGAAEGGNASAMAVTGSTKGKNKEIPAAASAQAKLIPFLYLWNGAQQGSPAFLLLDPVLLPPDLFSIPEEKGLSVSVVYETNRYELAYDASGKLALVPIRWAGGYTTVKIGRNSSALPINMELPDEKIRISVLEYENERPLRFQYEGEGERFFGVLHYWGNSADESWYSETGELKTLYEYTWAGDHLLRLDSLADDGTRKTMMQWDYNAQNLVSAMVDENGRTELAYDEKGRLLSAVMTTVDGTGTERNFQYDELGRLVRQYGKDEQGYFEYRYRYTMDLRGLWVKYSIQPWYEQFGRLVPGSEITITRTFARR
ncbi:MAG: RHS repeat protein [Treponema sp.]|nr:RHS repeat protein [Treponema sp.]